MTGDILVVEDNPLTAKLYSSIIDEMGVRARAVPTGEEAIDLAANEHPSMVIMDINLPGMSGVEASQYLRQIPGLEQLPILAVTARTEPMFEKFKEIGVFDELMFKPVTLSRFKQTIRDCLN